MSTNATPLSGAMARKNASEAASPPADAPMPTTGHLWRSGSAGDEDGRVLFCLPYFRSRGATPILSPSLVLPVN